jgi:hypothetical protein
MILATAANNISLPILNKYWGKYRGSIRNKLLYLSICTPWCYCFHDVKVYSPKVGDEFLNKKAPIIQMDPDARHRSLAHKSPNSLALASGSDGTSGLKLLPAPHAEDESHEKCLDKPVATVDHRQLPRNVFMNYRTD